MLRWRDRPANRILAVAGLILSLVAQLTPSVADAATGFQQAYIRIDRMKINTATSGQVCATPTTVATEGKVIVTFPATYTVNTTAANWTVNTTGIPGPNQWPSIATATSATSPLNVVTFPSGDLTVGTMYCFNFSGTSTLTTAAAAATSQQAIVETQTAASAPIDATSVALANIADDQIIVSAIVPPSFSFTLVGTAVSFISNLSPTAVVSTTGSTVTVLTNAKGGWIAWAKDSQQGLHSATASYTIPGSATPNDATPTTLTTTFEGFVMDVDATTDAPGGCSPVTPDPEFNGSTTGGGTLEAVFRPIASCTVGSPATANNDVITLTERATISGATPAATDYTDIITVVGAGNF